MDVVLDNSFGETVVTVQIDDGDRAAGDGAYVNALLSKRMLVRALVKYPVKVVSTNVIGSTVTGVKDSVVALTHVPKS